jgi:hypothetical protein
MHIWKWIGLGYVVLSFVAVLIVFSQLLWEDYRLHRDRWRMANSKFGYNLKWKGIGWWLMVACLPGVNLIAVAVFVAPHWIGHVLAVIELRCSRSR